MKDASQRFTIVFNGEIYNHIELRLLLPQIKWKGTSDTETLVELFSEMGFASLSLLQGMFAFAIYDSEDDSVVLVRDRLGIKPLWLRSHKNYISFASEVKVLLNRGEYLPTKQALSEYIAYGRMPETREIFPGLQTVPSGYWIKIQANQIIKKNKWWPDKNFRLCKIKKIGKCIEKVKHIITNTIEKHLISDVGIGAFLSGGIDSSIVALVAGRMLGSRLQTFTVGFPHSAYDERSIADQVAKKIGSVHYELEVSDEDCINLVKEAVDQMDLPSIDAINIFIVSKTVRHTGLKVALSGLGGDELFGGYPSFKNVPLLTWLDHLPIVVSNQLVNIMSQKIKEKLGGSKSFSTVDLTVARRRFTSVALLKSVGLDDGIPIIPRAPYGLDTMGQISWGELQGYTIPMLLRDSDQMSMACGLEIRVPFLDHMLVEEILQMQQNVKKGIGIKPLLVDAFKDELPLAVYNRPKQGFVLPMDNWMRGQLSEFTTEGVMIAADILKLKEPLLKKLSFDQGNTHWTRLWKWSVLGHWLKKHQSSNSL